MIIIVQLLTLDNQLIITKTADIYLNQQDFKFIEQFIFQIELSIKNIIVCDINMLLKVKEIFHKDLILHLQL